jgi:hypothetical protein
MIGEASNGRPLRLRRPILGACRFFKVGFLPNFEG